MSFDPLSQFSSMGLAPMEMAPGPACLSSASGAKPRAMTEDVRYILRPAQRADLHGRGGAASENGLGVGGGHRAQGTRQPGIPTFLWRLDFYEKVFCNI